MKEKIIVIVLLLTMGVLGYYGGYNRGQASKSGEFDRGYERGQNVGREEQKRIHELLGTNWENSYKELEKDHNALVKDYNTLVQLANTPQYQPRKPVTCNTYSFSEYSASTTCY